MTHSGEGNAPDRMFLRARCCARRTGLYPHHEGRMAEREESGGGRVPEVLPVLPLLTSMVFPTVTRTFDVGQERSLTLVRDVSAGDRLVAVFAQRSAERPAEELGELAPIGTMATVRSAARGRDGRLRVALHGLARIRLADLIKRDPYLVGRIEPRPDIAAQGPELDALTRAVRELFVRFVALSPEFLEQVGAAAETAKDAPTLSYLVAS